VPLTPEETFICKLPPVRINLSEALQIATDQKWSSAGQSQGNTLAWMRFSANFSLCMFITAMRVTGIMIEQQYTIACEGDQ